MLKVEDLFLTEDSVVLKLRHNFTGELITYECDGFIDDHEVDIGDELEIKWIK